jgi:hypothetical protein
VIRLTVLLGSVQRWECPNCDHTEVTTKTPKGAWFHACRGLKGLNAPMVLAGTSCKVEALEREDYIGRDMVHTDGDGRPVMSVRTTRDEGTDLAVLAPCVNVKMERA